MEALLRVYLKQVCGITGKEVLKAEVNKVYGEVKEGPTKCDAWMGKLTGELKRVDPKDFVDDPWKDSETPGSGGAVAIQLQTEAQGDSSSEEEDD
jgi:hypothetical protein